MNPQKNLLVLCLGAAALFVAACGSPSEVTLERGQQGRSYALTMSGSCVDACGSAAPTGDCWCDDLCHSYGDCCADKVDECGDLGGQPGSCAGACGGSAADGSCWCDDICFAYGDCCTDKEAECPTGNGECQTDADCPAGSLCEMTCLMYCSWEDPGCCNFGVCVPQPTATTCDGACGSAAADGSCWCDDLCESYGDCCADKQTFCPGSNGCTTDADCAPGEICAMVAMIDLCDPAFGNCGGSGICVPNNLGPCDGLDEATCIATPGCDPLYLEVIEVCAAGGYCPGMHGFICVESPEPDPCWGAWLDENNTCRAPNDGGYPQECCDDLLPPPPPPAECVTDADCFTTGCSGQYCASYDIMTTCEWLPEYACYAAADCGCNNGVCGFSWADEVPPECFVI